MTREELIALIKERDLLKAHPPLERFERFAALVAAKEREECAKVCDNIGDGDNGYGCAAAIRARKP